ncbi:MAG TPA: BrnA antitoxin family protein [Gemmatimonadaceae bacterium]|nr:BrnA antitoxin family protein [Gemmatimonadaceae bacterium]
MSKQRKDPSRGRADLKRLRRVSEAEIARSSPPELADLPDDFWDRAVIVDPPAKRAISLRVDEDVLDWFKARGPGYQTRMMAVLRSYVATVTIREKRGFARGIDTDVPRDEDRV